MEETTKGAQAEVVIAADIAVVVTEAEVVVMIVVEIATGEGGNICAKILIDMEETEKIETYSETGTKLEAETGKETECDTEIVAERGTAQERKVIGKKLEIGTGTQKETETAIETEEGTKIGIEIGIEIETKTETKIET